MIACLLVAATLAQDASPLLLLHETDAAAYAIYRDDAKMDKLELKSEPVYRWTNPTRNGGQEGDVFVWRSQGRPEAIGCVFSHPETGDRRVVCHEFHSLSEATLVVDRPGPNQWKPEAAGAEFLDVPGAPDPAASAPSRLRQMTAMAREFAATSQDDEGKRWDLRLLPKPLDRFDAGDADILDGALFAFVTSAGTDPELLVLLEARKGRDGRPHWAFSAARFSDLALWLTFRDREVWSSPRSAVGRFGRDEKERYRFYVDRIIDEIKPKQPR